MITKKHQTHNDGLVKICRVDNIADPPRKPKEHLVLKEQLRYKERTVGQQRFYNAMQAGVQIERVLDCPLRQNVSTQDVAIPNDGQQYRIVQVQYIEDAQPPEMRLTLEAVTQAYDIA